jgi:hypothetical protein
LDAYAPGYYNYDSTSIPTTKFKILMRYPGCRDHSNLKVDLTPVKDKLERIIGKNGHKYYHIEFEILATFHSAHVDYQWRCMGMI